MQVLPLLAPKVGAAVQPAGPDDCAAWERLHQFNGATVSIGAAARVPNEARTPRAGSGDPPTPSTRAPQLQLHGIGAPGAPACSSTILISRLRCFHSLRLRCPVGGGQGDPDRVLHVPADPLQGRNSAAIAATANCKSHCEESRAAVQARMQPPCQRFWRWQSGAPRHRDVAGMQVARRLITLVVLQRTVVQRHGARLWLACAGGRNANITQRTFQLPAPTAAAFGGQGGFAMPPPGPEGAADQEGRRVAAPRLMAPPPSMTPPPPPPPPDSPPQKPLIDGLGRGCPLLLAGLQVEHSSRNTGPSQRKTCSALRPSAGPILLQNGQQVDRRHDRRPRVLCSRHRFALTRCTLGAALTVPRKSVVVECRDLDGHQARGGRLMSPTAAPLAPGAGPPVSAH